jgi:DNA ligase D-like protein (predicted 3'-phosphoesterase)
MSLKEYERKRKFEKTPEPKGEVLETGKSRFVIHDHYAQKAGHHHDFRLEMEGVLKSWAVPKLMPEEKGIKRLAISVEDHPTSYYNFTGTIPKGEYGAGEVKIFDKGNYRLIEKDENKIVVELKGKKLKGFYALIKLKGKKNQWLIFKKE